MKKYLSAPAKLFFSVCTLFFLSGCLKDKNTKTYTIMRPLYESKATVLANIKTSTSQKLESPGKIYLYGKYIFLNEAGKGVHILDNSRPSQLSKVGFINIPGNIDIAVKGNTLYADLYTDLLAIDISDPLNAKLSKTVGHMFPERQYAFGYNRDTTQIIVDWIKKDTTVPVTDERLWLSNCANCSFLASAAGTNAPVTNGIGGSMARFAITGNYLYTVNQSSLGVLQIFNPANPVLIKQSGIGWNIETIYPFKDKLFIGSANGMFIYDIGNPAAPAALGQFSHARACDPVVADDEYAYVTLRAGTFCVGTNNQLDVIDVKSLTSPKLLKTYPMTNPHGLAKDGNLLFICDGKDGLKLYNASNPSSLSLIKHLSGMETFDAIAWNKKLLLVTTKGLYQYEYDAGGNMKLLDKMLINQ